MFVLTVSEGGGKGLSPEIQSNHSILSKNRAATGAGTMANRRNNAVFGIIFAMNENGLRGFAPDSEA